MARMKRIESDCAANYHVVSRCNNRSFFFASGKLKDQLADLLVRAAEFSGVEIKASCLMDNHFHIVVHVPEKEKAIAAEEVLRRIRILKGEEKAEILIKRWSGLSEGSLEVRLDGWRRRMQNLHEFVKTFKELVNIACKNDAKHTGTLFEGRYHSTLVQGGTYLAACIRYVEYNPIRAGIVRRAADYRWSTKNAEKANEISPHAGSDPEEEAWLLKRVAQLSQGQIFGSATFVRLKVTDFGSCFAAKSAGVRPVKDGEGALLPIEACSTHGHRLAKAA